MQSLLANFKPPTQEERESGYTLAELMVGSMMTIVLMAVAFPLIFNAMDNTIVIVNKENDVNQGVVADKAIELGLAATKFRQADNDAPLTKQALLNANPKIQIPAGWEWAVGSYGPENNEVCSVVYSPTEQTHKYTKQDPAEWNSHYKLKNATHSHGCWTTIDGNRVPNYNEVVPDYTQKSGHPTETQTLAAEGN